MNQNKEVPLITFIMTPQSTDSDVDYLQHFDEIQINKYTLKELCKLMKRKAEELEKIATARTALEQNEHFADISKKIEQKDKQ